MDALEPVGEFAWRATVSGDLREANARVRAAAATLRPDVRFTRVVSGTRSLLVELRDPRADLREVILASLEDELPRGPVGKMHEIEVRYDGEDLTTIAGIAKIEVDEVVALHAGTVYEVAFLGFQPGFAYLLGLPARLAAVGRLETPRTRVPEGGVAIASGWAGVYPSASPGGWRLLGRTPARLFDAEASNPALLAPGDRVRFLPT